MQVNDSFMDTIADLGHNKGELTPYLMFKYAIKIEITRKYYERRLKKFFDFIEFEIADKDIESLSFLYFIFKYYNIEIKYFNDYFYIVCYKIDKVDYRVNDLFYFFKYERFSLSNLFLFHLFFYIIIKNYMKKKNNQKIICLF